MTSNAKKHLSKCYFDEIEEEDTENENEERDKEDEAGNKVRDGQKARKALSKMLKNFEESWRAVTDAPTEEAYKTAWNLFKEEYGGPNRSPKLIKYIEDTWLAFRWYFLDCYTNVHQHWGTKVTSRTEGAHWRLKKQLENSRGDLRTVIKELMTLMKNWCTIYSQQLDIAGLDTKFRHHGPLLNHLLMKLSVYALNKLYEQSLLVKNHREGRKPFSACQHILSRTLGLPCCHAINARINRRGGDPEGFSLRMEDVHRH